MSLLLLGLLTLLAYPSLASAIVVPVEYLVDAGVLRRQLTSEAPVTVTLHSDAECSTPLATQVLTASTFDLIERLRPVRLRGASKSPRPARLSVAMTSPVAGAFVTMSGTGIAPIGGACQRLPVVSVVAPIACAPDAVPLGNACVDKYEGSIWSIPEGSALIAEVQAGTATRDDLIAGGATQVQPATTAGCEGTEYPPSFPLDGAYTEPLYAASIAGAVPSNCLTPHQAFAACALSGKRLLTSTEWVHAASGTPVPFPDDNGVTSCVLHSPAPVATGSRVDCVSTIGAHDMFGNLWEWTSIFDSDEHQFGLTWNRGAAFETGTGIDRNSASLSPAIAIHTDTGFRCAR